MPVGTIVAARRVVHLRFDHGTILITGAPETMDFTEAPGVRWDPRVRAHRAPAAAYGALRAWLLESRVRFVDAVRAEAPPTDGWAEIGLRGYQATALWAWELAGRRGVVVLPTGSGKTRVALAAMAHTRLPALCLVPTRVLLDQWCREIASVYPHEVGLYGDGHRNATPVTVATYESAYRHMDRLGHRFELLVADEAHHFGCGLRDEALEMSLASARLGLTATPPRSPPHLDLLGELVGPTVYELTIGDLTGRYLADFDTITVHLDLGRSERATYDRLSAVFVAAYGEFRARLPQGSWSDFARAATRTAEGRRALAAWREARRLLAFTEAKRQAVAVLLQRHRDARVLVFTADNDTAYAIAREHLVMPLTCDIGRPEREAALERFRRGDLRVLVSARVLNEGLDVPDADVAVIVGGAFGEREHVQRVGRLLRPGPGKRALVYELVTRRTFEVGQARRRREGLGLRSAL
ncbi:MAG: DEAD/DEAH box helicase family protein [Candidatus Rokuibacteriota bacterium]